MHINLFFLLHYKLKFENEKATVPIKINTQIVVVNAAKSQRVIRYLKNENLKIPENQSIYISRGNSFDWMTSNYFKHSIHCFKPLPVLTWNCWIKSIRNFAKICIAFGKIENNSNYITQFGQVLKPKTLSDCLKPTWRF